MRNAVPALFLAIALAGCASSGGSGPRAGGVKPYPLETCLVTGTKLGSMGDPYVIVHDGQQIKFCCEPCVAEFEKDPAKFLNLLPK